MKLIFLLMVFFSFHLGATTPCQEFKYIKSNIKTLTQKDLTYVMGEPEWLDEKFRREDTVRGGFIIGKTIVLLLLKRLTVLTYIFDSKRVGVSDFAGIYSLKPENYISFLALEPDRACLFLGMNGANADRLRDITHELAQEIYFIKQG